MFNYFMVLRFFYLINFFSKEGFPNYWILNSVASLIQIIEDEFFLLDV